MKSCPVPLHHVTYLNTKFAVATSNGLGGDTFTRNVVDSRMDRRTTFVQNKYKKKVGKLNQTC